MQRRGMRLRPWAGAVAALSLGMGGCVAQTSPSLPLFGAYFPSWLICTTAGVIGAVLMRGVFIKLGIDEVLPWRLLVYACLAAGIGFVLALAVYGR